MHYGLNRLNDYLFKEILAGILLFLGNFLMKYSTLE